MAANPTVMFLFAGVASRAGSVILIPLYARSLSPVEYGKVALYQSLLVFLPLWFSLGSTSALPHFYFSTKEGPEREVRLFRFALVQFRIVATAFLVHCVLVWAGMALGWIAKDGVVYWVLFGGACLGFGSLVESYLRVSRRAHQAMLLSIAGAATQIGSGLLLVWYLRRGALGVIEAQVAPAVVTAIAAIALVFSWSRHDVGVVGAHVGGMPGVSAVEVMRFSLPFLPHFLAGWVYGMADRWILAGVGLDADLGRYALASQIAIPVALVATATNDAQTAEIGRLLSQSSGRDFLTAGRRFFPRILIPVLVAAIGVALVSPLVPVLLGPNYEGLWGFVVAVALIGVVESLYYPASNMLYFSGKSALIPIATILSAIASLVLVWGLASFAGVWGVLGARLLGAGLRVFVFVFFVMIAARAVRRGGVA